MKRIALTGGIAAGKSTISNHLKMQTIAVIDYDVIAREVVEPGSSLLDEICAAFGSDVLDASGHLNRPWLAQNVFNDDARLKKLNAIMHPAIYAAAACQDTECEQKGHDIVVHDIPLLAQTMQIAREAGLRFDAIIDVEAPDDVRIERMMKTRGMTYQAAQGRISSQSSRREREKIADYVIDSAQPLDEMLGCVDTILETIIKRITKA